MSIHEKYAKRKQEEGIFIFQMPVSRGNFGTAVIFILERRSRSPLDRVLATSHLLLSSNQFQWLDICFLSCNNARIRLCAGEVVSIEYWQGFFRGGAHSKRFVEL